MSKTQRVPVTKKQWDEAAAAYELGDKHASQIARELSVSPATVSREFKRRGCVKASRVAETIAKIEARLDAEAAEKARADAVAAAERRSTVGMLVEELMEALEAAKQQGGVSMANPDIARIDRELRRALA